MENKIFIEVAFATPEKQMIIECHVLPDTSPRDAVKLSGIDRHFPEIDLDNSDLGVFGKAVPEDYVLQEGDRIEIYRPLIADPREIRRQRAAQGLKTGKGGGPANRD